MSIGFVARPFAYVRFALILVAATLVGSGAQADNQQKKQNPGDKPQTEEVPLPDGGSLTWHLGPTTAQLGNLAQIKVPDGYQFLDSAGTRKYMELMQNPTSGRELGTISPGNGDWFIVFEFDSIGYVKDDERDSIDADAILQSFREGTTQGNVERKKRGWATMEIVGWEYPPNYDTKTNNLQWAIKAQSENHPIVNFNTRLLGRSGVMAVTLVAEPESLAAVVPTYKELLTGFSYLPGNKYGEFRAGDKVAEYGLTALVAGGAAAVAAKTGLLAKLAGLLAKGGKAILVVVIAAGAALKAFWSKLFGGARADR